MSHSAHASFGERVQRRLRRHHSTASTAATKSKLSRVDRKAAAEYAAMTGMYRPVSELAAEANARPMPVRPAKYVGPPQG